jgi:hypothetical protein
MAISGERILRFLNFDVFVKTTHPAKKCGHSAGMAVDSPILFMVKMDAGGAEA